MPRGAGFHAFLAPFLYPAPMDHFGAIGGELICVRPEATQVSRRRLFVERLAAGGERYPVKVTALQPKGCAIAGPPNLAELPGRLWLKFPGYEAIEVAAIAEEGERLVCWFMQPVHPATVQAIARPRNAVVRPSAFRPRCTIF